MAQYELCVRCLRKSHSGPCKNDKCNKVCPKCDNKYHNSALCPNASAKPAFKASNSQNKKRKHSGDQNQDDNAKKKRYNSNNSPDGSKQNDMQSSVHKIGDWALVAKQSNAIKQFNARESSKFEHTVLLATLNMKIQATYDLIMHCRALADTGATLNCITARFVTENQLKTKKCQRRILGVSGPELIKRKVRATIRPWFDSKEKLIVEFFILKQLDGIYPDKQIEASKDEIMDLGLADVDFDVPAPINAILGAEIYANIIGTNLYKHKNGAIMQSTSFGHIILGTFVVKKNYSSDLPILSIMHNNDINEIESECISKALCKFWEIEEINKYEMLLNKEQQMVEDLFVKTHYRNANGRYVVTIPIKPNPENLGESKAIAYRQFMQLERRLQRNNDLKQKYIDYMRENQKQGYMQLAEKPANPNLCYWIPHHPILKKFRIVLNASMMTSANESLNSIQMIGGKLQFDSQLQTMRFRRHRYAIITDIIKMFNQVFLNQEQWDLHRIFWREAPDEPLKEYVMTVVIFGEASSPYNAVRAMIQNARDYAENYPEAAEAIEKSFYMDDGMFGCENINELKILCKEVEFVLGQGGFSLKGWASNSKEVEAYMNTSVSNEVILGENDETKILGLRWLKSTDELSIFVKQMEKPKSITKRTILSDIAKLFDPNGFISPVIVRAKMLMQDIWRLKDCIWDDEVPESIKREWTEIYANLPLLSDFKIKRWLQIDSKSEVQIHGFCDACEKAYGTSIYIRAKNEAGEIFCTLLSAKSKVAPLKPVTIPRLELLGALMLSEQIKAVIEACELKKCSVTLWSTPPSL